MYPKAKPKRLSHSSDKATDIRQNRLKRLQESNEFRAKLIKRLKERLGDHTEIDEEIKNLIQDKGLSQANLNKLENDLKSKLRRTPTRLEPLSQSPESPVKSVILTQRVGSVSPYPRGAKPETRMTNFTASEDYWATLATYEALVTKDEDLERKTLEEGRKKKLREELNKQMQQRKSEQQRFRREMKDYEEYLSKSFEKQEVEEYKKQQELRRKLKVEQRIRLMQLKDEQRRKRDELRMMKESEQQRLKLIEEELKAEEAKKEEKRRQEKEAYSKVMKDNERRQHERSLLKEAERQLEVKMAEDYTKLVEEQERKRAESIKARLDRQQQFMDRMKNTVIKERETKAKEEDNLLMKLTQIREVNEEEDEKKRKKRNADIEQEMRRFQLTQIQEQKRQKDIEKQAQDLAKKEWNEVAVKHTKTIEAERELQREKLLKNAELVKLQMKEKRNKTFAMSPDEFALNRERIRQAKRRIAEHAKLSTSFN
mmetsp:Transcript_28862/g.51431  ORF Transcript_28862/g.51431 Transcript_28862/m.51431 type:complete len:484 (-) Transcript_28862:477-1928(-)|eukprot:CAMPEP_0204898714 /NCGR_PEP_ID=MMETSP1397-20131031/1448_1 /ASSEMBLY_ACC=CAM_ASM_000891 /TAXON_ID=49980 /ORGANISM="Climacostomum Climacostomum virens, Strain Stock W-24" /LENGTH=483 /DNA_ID=CAMNT_0052066597 /DNA_START=76 /DNA_END=1527 /DNA_ORIENTATION=+